MAAKKTSAAQRRARAEFVRRFAKRPKAKATKRKKRSSAKRKRKHAKPKARHRKAPHYFAHRGSLYRRVGTVQQG